MSSRTFQQLWHLVLVATAILVVSLVIVGCSGAQPTAAPAPAPTNTPAPAPTNTPVPPTKAPVPTNTPAPEPTKAAQPADNAAKGLDKFTPQPNAQAMSEEDKAQAKAIAEEMGKQIGLQDFSWEAWTLSADTTWDDTLSYYEKQAADAGWSPDASQTGDFEGGKYAVFGEAKTQTMLVIIWAKNESQNRAEVLAIFGTIPQTAGAAATSAPEPTNTPAPEPTNTPEQAAPPAEPAQQAPANTSGFTAPAGKALFVFYNYTNVDWNIDIGPNLLKVSANQPGQEFAVGTMALDPGSYTWKANSPGGGYGIKDANGNVAFDFTVAAGDVYAQGVH